MSANYQAQLAEIADARRAMERITAAIAERQQQAEQMASADQQFYQASAVARQLAEIAELEDRQRVAELRIKALERQLPSEQARATARAEAEALADAALEAAAGAEPAWESFLAALNAAEIAATAFATAKAGADAKAHQARTLKGQFGLSGVAVPPRVVPEPTAAKIAHLQTVLLTRFVGSGEIDAAVLGELAGARRRTDAA